MKQKASFHIISKTSYRSFETFLCFPRETSSLLLFYAIQKLQSNWEFIETNMSRFDCKEITYDVNKKIF